MSREVLFQAVNVAMREVSGLGVMYSQAVAAKLGVSSTDLECLDYVVTRGPIAAGALAQATGLTTGAITGMIDRLERAGFAAREADPTDRRKVLVRALPSVERRAAPLFEPMVRAAQAALSGYSDEDLALLLRFLSDCREAAQSAMKEVHAAPASRAKSGPKERAHGHGAGTRRQGR